jgi:DNA-binding response OmpR family regulator
MTTTRVLLVDDDVATLEMFRQALRLSGFDVRTAADGVAALSHVERDLPDVIVLDLDLPHVNGLDLQEEFRARPDTCATPIIIMTATDWQPRAQPFALLRKPVPVDRLVATIERAAADMLPS